MDGEPIRSQPKPVPRPKKPRKPMARKRLRKKPPRRLSSPSADPGYLEFVRTLQCRFAHTVFGRFCFGDIHAHHSGPRPGVAMKAPDDTAVPLCAGHHYDFHRLTGPFAGMTKADRLAWSVVAIAETRAAYKLRSKLT